MAKALVLLAFVDKEDGTTRYDPAGPYVQQVFEGSDKRIGELAEKGFVDPDAELPEDPNKAAEASEDDAEAKAKADEAEAKEQAEKEAAEKVEADAKAKADAEAKTKTASKTKE